MVLSAANGDFCTQKRNNDALKVALAFIGLSNQCSFQAETIKCSSNEKIITLSKSMKKLLPTFTIHKDPIYIHADIAHDTGKSCFDSEVNFVRV